MLSFILFTFLIANEHCRFNQISDAEGIDSNTLARTITAWKAQNRQATSADIICCLPERWRRSYVVVSESHSLQCSSSEFPRIIIFDPSTDQTNSQPLNTAISFVGQPVGDTPCNYKFSGNNNSHDLEIMEFNRRAPAEDMFQFVHFDPNKERPVDRRPYVCMDCHGTPQGWRPLSRDSSHPSTHLGGLANPGRSGFLSCDTPAEIAQQERWNRDFRRLSTVQNQRPYSCLPNAAQASGQPQGRNLANANQQFIERLSISQNFQVAEKIRKLPQYNTYRLAFAAAALGCANVNDLERECSPNTVRTTMPPPGRSLMDYVGTLPTSRSQRISFERPQSMICQNTSGLCGTRIPEQCRELLRQTNSLVERAKQVPPEAYGEILSNAFFNQGRSALFSVDRVQRHTQLAYLIQQQSDNNRNSFSEIMNEYAGPNSINFDHLAGLLIESDPALKNQLGGTDPIRDRETACIKLLSPRARALRSNEEIGTR